MIKKGFKNDLLTYIIHNCRIDTFKSFLSDMISIKSLLYMYNDNSFSLPKTLAFHGIKATFLLMLAVYSINVAIGSSKYFDTCNSSSSCYKQKQA